MPGQGDEHVVEGGAAQAYVVDLDAPAVEFADDLGEQLGTARHGHGQFAGVLLDRGLALAEAGEHLARGGDVLPLVDDDLHALAAGTGLELVGGAAGDDLAVVDHADVVREVVGLLQVLGGEEQGGAAGDQFLDDAPQLLAVAGVESGGRLVHEHHGWADDEGGREVQAPAHAAGVRLGRAVRGVGEVEAFEEFGGPGFGRLGLHLVELADHLEVLAAGQVLVYGRELAGQADGPADFVGVFEHVHAGDDGLAAVGPQEGGQDTYGRGLARAVRAEQTQDGAFGDIEVHAVESPYIAEGLDQTFGVDSAWHMDSPSESGQ